VYKSNKPAAITTVAASQTHTSDNEYLQQSQTPFTPNIQLSGVSADVVAQVATTKLPQSIPSSNTYATMATDKELPSDASATDCSTEEDEDDEYRKIQKVTTTMVSLFLNIY